jgi:integrase
MKQNWIGTAHKGLRYYEHPTRKCGKQRDKYYTIRFRIDGTLHTYGVGWLSDEVPKTILEEDPALGFQDYCLKLLREYKGNVKSGSGAKSPREKRKIDAEKSIACEIELERLERENLTFGDIFTKEYFPIAKQNKVKGTWTTEESIFNKWIDPVIGSLPLKDISPIHLEKIKKTMSDKSKSARTAAYCLSIIRQVYNFANLNNFYPGSWPGANKSVKIPREDNTRQRYLTHQEANALLSGLQAISPDVHDMALLSLNCGLRAGEVFNLTWADADLKKKTIFIRDPKNKHNRFAYMTDAVKTMLDNRMHGKQNDYIFSRRSQSKEQDEREDGIMDPVDRISKTFNRVVTGLNLNKDITDRRQRLVFHSLRHTYASWLVEDGVSLYTVQKLLGHTQIKQTERYSHLSPENFRGAVKVLETAILKAKKKKGELVKFEK